MNSNSGFQRDESAQQRPANRELKPLMPPNTRDTLRPDPGNLLDLGPIDLPCLRRLTDRSILSAKDLDRPMVVELCRLAAVLETLEIASSHPLDGKLVITAFFEASTRTRISFESAVLRLDGKIISIPIGDVTGVKKGESLADIGEMFNAYGDLVIMRHTETDSVNEIRRNLRIPLINAGNGSGEHPTQALADWYALLKWRPSLAMNGCAEKTLHLGILGTPGSMRAVKSFLLLALLFQDHIARVTVISQMADPFGPELVSDLTNASIDHYVTNDMETVVSDLDVIYMNSITFLGDSYKALDSRYKLASDSPLKENAVILHPLARLDELDTSLDATAHNLYFSQAHGAVFVRQALLMSILRRLDRLPDGIPTRD